MTKRVKLLTLLVVGFSATFCAKKKDDPTPFNNTSGNIQNGFSWSEDGGTVISADSAFWTAGTWGAGIRAYKGGYLNFFELNFDNSNTGGHTLGGSSAFLKGSDTYSIASGNINVTANTQDQLSGNFDAKITGGTIKTLKGSFTGLKKK